MYRKVTQGSLATDKATPERPNLDRVAKRMGEKATSDSEDGMDSQMTDVDAEGYAEGDADMEAEQFSQSPTESNSVDSCNPGDRMFCELSPIFLLLASFPSLRITCGTMTNKGSRVPACCLNIPASVCF